MGFPKQTSETEHQAQLPLFKQSRTLVQQIRLMQIQIPTECLMAGKFGLLVGMFLTMRGL